MRSRNNRHVQSVQEANSQGLTNSQTDKTDRQTKTNKWINPTVCRSVTEVIYTFSKVKRYFKHRKQNEKNKHNTAQVSYL